MRTVNLRFSKTMVFHLMRIAVFTMKHPQDTWYDRNATALVRSSAGRLTPENPT